MELQPPSLNVPLQRTERWGLLLVAVCIVVTCIAAFFSPSFATVFAASSIVGLPVLLLLIFPSALSSKLLALGNLGRIISLAFFFAYVALAKSVLVPAVIGVIERALV